MLICTEANEKFKEISEAKSNILDVILCNQHNIGKYISLVCEKYNRYSFDPQIWIDSEYMPTPTIIEAARTLYSKHNVEDISRNDASAINLSKTMKSVSDIIEYSKKNNKKSICFITGVPGAGKTLAGLNIAVKRQDVDKNEHAVFLSGNGPLVDVLQEALTRDGALASDTSKADTRRKVKDFIQIIHHFRDDAISTDEPPVERVVIFDEAQRAWDELNLSNFMKVKKGKANFNMSEPDFLISILNRHVGWAVIVCLIGGGKR